MSHKGHTHRRHGSLESLSLIGDVDGAIPRVRGYGHWVPLLVSDIELRADADARLAVHVAAPDPHPGYLTEAAAAGLYQGLHGNLTTLAGIVLSARGQAILSAATAAEQKPYLPTAVELGAALPDIRPDLKAWQVWQKLSAGQPTAAALADQSMFAQLHHEQTGRTFSAMGVEVNVAIAASSGRLMLWSTRADGKGPDELLWTSAAIDTTTTGLKSALFSAGTWTAAGAAWKDGTNRLVLPVGRTCHPCWLVNGGAVGVRVMAPTECRGCITGIDEVTWNQSHTTGWRLLAVVIGAVPTPWTGTPTPYTTNAPMIGLLPA